MVEEPEEIQEDSQPEKQSVFGVIVHSFFVVPFLIAVFSVLLFASVRMLTLEEKTAFDYLNDVKVGSLNKRWQAAFELSKILANPELTPKEDRFASEMIRAFEQSRHDDDRIRQYLALAMGRAGNPQYAAALTKGLEDEKEENLGALIYGIGMAGDAAAAIILEGYLMHTDPQIRLTTVIALGTIGNPQSIPALKKALHDSEPNVGWDAAIALAKLGDMTGKETLMNLLNRDFLKGFANIDNEEQSHVLQVAIEAAAMLNDVELNQAIAKLSDYDPNMNVRKMAMAVMEK